MARQASRRGTPVFRVGRLLGTFRIAADRKAYADDTGDVLAVGCHAGDLLSRYARGQRGPVCAILDEIAQYYSFIRTWSFLNGSYWAGRTFDLTTDVLRDFCTDLRIRGLKVLLSQGDLFQSGVSSGTQGRLREVLLHALETHRDVFVGVDACNEPCNNSDATPAQLADWIRPIVRAYPDLPCSLGSVTEVRSGDAYAALRREYCIDPANVYDHHISGPSEDSLIERQWTEGYESPLWLHVASEPRGDGPQVTPPQVSDVNRLCQMAIASVMSGGLYVWFSSPGVKSDLGESFPSMAGFAEVPQAVAMLPTTIHRWRRFHGGWDRDFSIDRIYAVPRGADDCRAEHALASDGRFVVLLHGETWRECYALKPHRIEKQVEFGELGRLIIGTV